MRALSNPVTKARAYKRSRNLWTLFVCCIVAAACSQPTGFSRFQYTPSVSVPDHGASPLRGALYSFGENPDGALPTAPLINVGGTLYGTTSRGGVYDRGGTSPQGGTVFSITTNGAEKVLHSFGNGSDGANPTAGLVNVNGTLYGTTFYGGTSNAGTVFSISASGAEKVLYNFKRPNGALPAASLIKVNGTLYGTTYEGGTANQGTVYTISTSGAENVLYSFKGDPDGANPSAPLIDFKGTLYGTTWQGGLYGTGKGGTVFSITTSGAEKVLHSFGEGTDGSSPSAGLVVVGRKLYGTTFTGGGYNVSRGGDGTVFSITTGGKEKVLYSFGSLPDDGQFPVAGLINVKGTLYGTNELGGAHKFFGTVFSITTGGTETVLLSLGHDRGVRPKADLIDVKGKLYGTAWEGGTMPCSCGTVFVLRP